MNLVKIDSNRELFTTSKIVAEALSGKKDQHRNVFITIEKMLKDDDLFQVERSRGHANAPKAHNTTVYMSKNGCSKFELTFYTVNNRKYKMYKMNEGAYTLLVINLSRYKNARKIQHDFINAFFMMKDLLAKKTKTIEHLVVDGILPVDKKGTLSKVNGEKREELVKSYYRSQNGKKDLELDEKVRMIQLSLFDFEQIEK